MIAFTGVSRILYLTNLRTLASTGVVLTLSNQPELIVSAGVES
jgi:hypothetical protein